MRLLLAAAAVAFASVLVPPATAAALTTSQAQAADSAKLAGKYGSAWLRHSPAWSQPECRQPDLNQVFSCNAEFEYRGVWRYVTANVQGGRVTLYPVHRWVRKWAPEPARCQHETNQTVVGQLFTNNGGCNAILLYQNFGLSGQTPGVIRYTGYKRSLFYFGTDTALLPDFFVYHCTWRNRVYQCTNRFGDGLRWKPYSATRGTGPLHLTDFRSADRSVWCVIQGVGGPQAYCGSPEPTAGNPPQRAATLYSGGKVTLCNVAVPSFRDACIQNWDSAAPALQAGQETEADGFLCKSQTSGMTCTLAAGMGKGKGFFISSTTVRQVGP